jgi:glyoxylase I family protein
VAGGRGFTLVHRSSGETLEARSLVHPSGVAVTVKTHDGTAEHVRSMNGASVPTTWRSGSRIGMNCNDRRRIFESKGVTHSGIIDIGFGPTVVFRDPNNMQLEFYVHQIADEIQVNAADSEEAQRALREALAKPVTS